MSVTITKCWKLFKLKVNNTRINHKKRIFIFKILLYDSVVKIGSCQFN